MDVDLPAAVDGEGYATTGCCTVWRKALHAASFELRRQDDKQTVVARLAEQESKDHPTEVLRSTRTAPQAQDFQEVIHALMGASQ